MHYILYAFLVEVIIFSIYFDACARTHKLKYVNIVDILQHINTFILSQHLGRFHVCLIQKISLDIHLSFCVYKWCYFSLLKVEDRTIDQMISIYLTLIFFSIFLYSDCGILQSSPQWMRNLVVSYYY